MNALNRLGVDYTLSRDVRVIQHADKVIFPGVGHAGAAMDSLRKYGLVEVIKNLHQPVLGICVGMQLLCDHSDEGDTACLGILPHPVTRFNGGMELKVPHMGWNTVHPIGDDGLFGEIEHGSYFYFVHSYFVPQIRETTAICTYQLPFSAAVRKDNFYGIQFHAEKSGQVGEKLLSNFLNGEL